MDKKTKQKERSIALKINRIASSNAKASMKYYEREFGIGVSHVRILHALADGAVHSKAVVAWTGMDKGIVSRALTDLTRRGLVFAADDPNDLRSPIWRLTEEGEATQAALDVIRQRRLETIKAAFTPEEYVQIHHLLDRLYVAFEKVRLMEETFLKQLRKRSD